MFTHKSWQKVEVGPSHCTAEKRPLVGVNLEIRWTSELVYTFWRRGKSFPPARDKKCFL